MTNVSEATGAPTVALKGSSSSSSSSMSSSSSSSSTSGSSGAGGSVAASEEAALAGTYSKTQRRWPARRNRWRPAFEGDGEFGPVPLRFRLPRHGKGDRAALQASLRRRGRAGSRTRSSEGAAGSCARVVTVGANRRQRVHQRPIYYLITKPRYFHKPTLDALRQSLEVMRTTSAASPTTTAGWIGASRCRESGAASTVCRGSGGDGRGARRMCATCFQTSSTARAFR